MRDRRPWTHLATIQQAQRRRTVLFVVGDAEGVTVAARAWRSGFDAIRFMSLDFELASKSLASVYHRTLLAGQVVVDHGAEGDLDALHGVHDVDRVHGRRLEPEDITKRRRAGNGGQGLPHW
jgi:hypothetical protein